MLTTKEFTSQQGKDEHQHTAGKMKSNFGKRKKKAGVYITNIQYHWVIKEMQIKIIFDHQIEGRSEGQRGGQEFC